MLFGTKHDSIQRENVTSFIYPGEARKLAYVIIMPKICQAKCNIYNTCIRNISKQMMAERSLLNINNLLDLLKIIKT